MYRTRRKSGFTLVEILIVVIILGILAAIVIPQFTNASQDARKSNLASQVQTLKSQIELFKLQHHDKPPLLITTGWTVFTSCTNDQGVVNPSATPTVPDPANGYIYGPYMQANPMNPLTSSDQLVAAAAAGKGWQYTEATGEIHGIAVDKTGTAVATDDGVNDLASPPNLIQY